MTIALKQLLAETMGQVFICALATQVSLAMVKAVKCAWKTNTDRIWMCLPHANLVPKVAARMV